MSKRKPALLRKSRSAFFRYGKQPLDFEASCLGQNCPQHCPQPDGVPSAAPADPLGVPLTIHEAARMIGCSPWTVRQKYLPLGIPHHRASPNGKLIFYQNQITRWLLQQQEKGGMKP
jgi:hypothetical protein